jgi:hypothetical protein
MFGKRLLLVATAALVLVAPASAAGDASYRSPGHKMHRYGSHGHPGASYWAPGHQKRLHRSTSASRYAPGHRSY